MSPTWSLTEKPGGTNWVFSFTNKSCIKTQTGSGLHSFGSFWNDVRALRRPNVAGDVPNKKVQLQRYETQVSIFTNLNPALTASSASSILLSGL